MTKENRPNQAGAREDFAVDHLDGKAREVADVIVAVIRDVYGKEPSGGGCPAFFTPEQWKEKCYPDGQPHDDGGFIADPGELEDAILLLCHDGGNLARFCSYLEGDIDAQEALHEALGGLGAHVERLRSYCSAVYPGAERAKTVELQIQPGMPPIPFSRRSSRPAGVSQQEWEGALDHAFHLEGHYAEVGRYFRSRGTVLPHIGGVVVQPGVIEVTPRAEQVFDAKVIATAVGRHLRGDWGEMPEEDRVAVDAALREGGRLVSSYDTASGAMWIITEADRSRTTVLHPDEY